jgi:hypothetical protein
MEIVTRLLSYTKVWVFIIKENKQIDFTWLFALRYGKVVKAYTE